ncbi:ABC transporter permease [Aliikangiella coralliicola]|uniref:FtsX-like permease family protein n=1 Tax=Aliikangiella coralliicola TaxID=2592383 RepID=A0A545U4F4_9GAMM|nr:ABC transporter permease [Aliikangiella coralliicola]TQV84342.1 FtsX-like permease family protein [Aliikangiella coralliicola]
MLANYFKLALRNLTKHRLYAFINVTGLTLGLTIFVFSSLLINYEENHDHMFSDRDRIFTVGSIFSPASGEPISEFPNVRLAYAPLLKAEIKQAGLVARSVLRERILKTKRKSYYEGIRFVEKDFTRIFDFQYIHGDQTATDDPHGLVLTASTAKKLFGHTDVLGESVILEHVYNMKVTAVIEDVSADSHFNSSLMPNTKLTAFASLQALVAVSDFNETGDWNSLNPADLTYVLLQKNISRAWLQERVDLVYARFTPESQRDYISALKVRPLIEQNTQVWEALGFPVLESVRLLGLLILITACLNYANLAIAQSFGRTREVGLRKTFGAEKSQLYTQFLTESLTLTAFAMLIALSSIELLVPAYNEWSSKEVILNYQTILPQLVLVTLIVGFMAGAYPAYLISRDSPINSLHGTLLKSRQGHSFRNLMIAAQFSISIFILALVMIIYFQNQKVQTLSSAFPRSQIIVLERMGIDQIKENYQALSHEIKQVKGVQSMTFSAGVPFLETGSSGIVATTKNGESLEVKLYLVSIDFDFMKTYDIELLAGRSFDPKIDADVLTPGSKQANVIVNPLAAEKLGFGRNYNVIGQSFFSLPEDSEQQNRECISNRPSNRCETLQYNIVGLMPDQYFLGVHMKKRPIIFLVKPQTHRYASIRLNQNADAETLVNIDRAWSQVFENYPIIRQPLEFYFNRFFRIPSVIYQVIAFFAGIALSLSLIGLFGLSAFMARRRTKEIGIRKVMGASVNQIVRLLIWQISLPVMWSMLIAIPAAYFAADIYLNFFPERIESVVPLIIVASVISILTAWGVIAAHAISTANETPITSLRYE